MNSKFITVLAICSFGLCSCTTKRTDLGFVDYTAKNITKSYTKIGKGCNYGLFTSSINGTQYGGFRWGEATIENVARENGITNIVTIENATSVYPFFVKECVIVKGN